MSGYIGTKASVTQVDGYNRTEADDRYVNASGDTMTGTLSVSNTFPEIRLDNTDAGGNSWRIASGSSASGFAGKLQIYNEDTATVAAYIDSLGRVTMPYQPAFCASPNGSGTDYSYGQPDQPQVFYQVWYNTGNHYSTSTGRFTAPVSGYYHLWCGGTSYCAGRNRYITTFWYRNGSEFSAAGRGRAMTAGSGTEYVSPTLSNVVYLSANDYIQLYTYGEVGASAAYMHSLEFNWGARLIG